MAAIRTERVMHNHITQTDDIIEDCAACALIRPEVMTGTAGRILRHNTQNIFGPPRQP